MQHRFFFFIVFLLASSLGLWAQSIERIEPAFWWAGMSNPKLQLLVHGPQIGQTIPSVEYPGVRVAQVHTVENANYLFIDLELAPNVQPGSFDLSFTHEGSPVQVYRYELKARKPNSAQRPTFTSADVMYLIMPDRFANGDPTNDNIAGMREKADRQNPSGRHGGDIEGIRQRLDYISDLGFTAIWLNPVLENDMPDFSYHGYATTDFYSIDRRYGGNAAYLQLVEQAHERGIKVVMDMIFNHCGSAHWWMNDLPSADWLNQWPTYTQTNYRGTTLADPYASKFDRDQMVNGWFVPTMPDLNQKNTLVENYLIQNSIWWIEYADLNGIRMDTHPYADKHMMTRWIERVQAEYPGFMIVGEVWLDDPAALAYWSKGAQNYDGFDSKLPGLIDFPVMQAIKRSLNQENGWYDGAAGLYQVFAMDYHYKDPNTNLTFLDNHDLSRIWSELGKDIRKFKMATTLLLTTRGIPMVYYATEVLSEGREPEGHGFIRRDFPGGWPSDKRNAFEAKGRTALENEAFDHLRTLVRWRKNKDVVHKGRLTHWLPANGIYALARTTDTATVLVLINNDQRAQAPAWEHYQEVLTGRTMAYEVLSGKKVKLADLRLAPKSAVVLEIE